MDDYDEGKKVSQNCGLNDQESKCPNDLCTNLKRSMNSQTSVKLIM